MINEDSTNALFVEPNAYIQHFNPPKQEKKIVFQEPYETLPNYYMNNNFTKKNCDCVPTNKPCNHNQNNSNPFPFSFDFKSLAPLLAGLFKGGNASNIINLLGKSGSESGEGFNLSNIFSGLQSMGGIDKIFDFLKPKKKENSNTKSKLKERKTTDFEIKNYTKVE